MLEEMGSARIEVLTDAEADARIEADGNGSDCGPHGSGGWQYHLG